MQILGTKSAGCWHRRMRCLLLCATESNSQSGNGSSSAGLRNQHYSQLARLEAVKNTCHPQYKVVATTRCHQPCRTCASTTESASKGFQWLYRGSHTESLVKKVPINFPSQQKEYMLQCQRWLSDFLQMKGNGSASQGFINQDLRRFLEEVGTDPKEARYWLKQFQRLGSAPSNTFAVVQVHQEIFRQPQLLEALSSNLAFLHRNDMKLLVIHGSQLPDNVTYTNEELQANRQQVTTETMVMVNFLESSGARAHPMFSGSSVLKAESVDGTLKGEVSCVNKEPLEWCMSSGHIPVVSAIGETASSQLVSIDTDQATAAIAKTMQPLKTLLLNTSGGLVDDKKKTIGQVHVPTDIEKLVKKPWFAPKYGQQVEFVVNLLAGLPPLSSVVVTSANSILAELFTHHGSGTMFKNTERILKFDSLKKVDLDRLNSLLTRSFGRVLHSDYMSELPKKLHTIYLSEGYNAVAIITNEKEAGEVPYLDKFSISQKSQGEGTSDMLWDVMRSDFPSLFWRSRNANKINPWYFKRCEGSWTNSEWTVFWYGISDPQVSYKLVDWAVKKKPSFLTAHEKEFESTHMLDLI
ncbi:N-acetylglutamate synthase, mitochondrial-like [Amphiura filiformis]|uniref:N-acetylglutamate synthase, mitochondrial-like n=1 Tax=Amphiura filiformis TaxID=82378 RepID=UPI003B21102D